MVDGIWTYKVVHKKLVRKNAIKSKPKLRSTLPAVGKKRKRESGQRRLAMYIIVVIFMYEIDDAGVLGKTESQDCYCNFFERSIWI